MKRATEEGAADGECATRKKRCHTQDGDTDPPHASSSAAAAAAHLPPLPVLVAARAPKIPKFVAFELALYQTQSPVVTEAVLKYHQVERNTFELDTTLFASSIINGEEEKVRLLLDNGVAVDTEIGNDLSPLPVHIASKHGQLEILKLLMSRGASITTDISGNSLPPLVLACMEGHLEIVKWLVENGAIEDNVKTTGPAAIGQAVVLGYLEIARYLISVDEQHTLRDAALSIALISGRLRVIKNLVENNLIDLAEMGHMRDFAVTTATANEDTGMLRYLLGLGVFKPSELVEALGIATQRQNLEIIKLLVSHGANIDAFTVYRQQTPLFRAIEHNLVSTVETLLVLGADVNKPANEENLSAIHVMASLGRVEMLQLVQRVCGLSGEDFKAPNRRERETPLHLAASAGRVDVVRFLLEVLKPDVDIDVETRYDDTPLSLAAKNGHLDVVRVLVAGGAAINNDANGGGPTALFCAAMGGQFDGVQFLCEHGANVLWRRYDGVSALCIASRNGSADIVEYLAEACSADLNAVTFDLTALNEAVIHGQTDVMRVLLAHNASTRDDLERRSNLLCQAIIYKSTDIAHLLVKNGADVNACYALTVNDVELEVTPLIVAAGTGNLEMTQFLCANGADVEGVSNESETALFFAATFEKLDIVEYLATEQNANVQTSSSYGVTPVDVGGSPRDEKIVECLVRHGALPSTRKMLAKVAFDVLSASESPLLQAGTLVLDATYWRRKAGVGSLLTGDFLR